jgi:ABC-type dipeptide/oligopeptide/nickel transport system permease component
MSFEYLIRRLALAVPTVFIVSVLVFGLMHMLPGEPVEIMLSEFGGTAEDIERLREQLGLNDPLYVQLGRFLWDALHGDLGRSLFNRRPVVDQILVQVPSTLQLTAASVLISLIIGVPLGIIAAIKHRSWIDALCMLFALVNVSAPTFWLALVMILVFSLELGWFPATGSQGLRSLILPAVSLGVASAGLIARLVRSSMLEVLSQNYMVTARSKGLREYIIILRHGFRNALIPTVTILGVQIGNLLGGAVVVETVFARQGLGRMVIQAIMKKDYPLVQGTLLFIAVAYVVINLLIDWLYSFLDPRIST